MHCETALCNPRRNKRGSISALYALGGRCCSKGRCSFGRNDGNVGGNEEARNLASLYASGLSKMGCYYHAACCHVVHYGNRVQDRAPRYRIICCISFFTSGDAYSSKWLPSSSRHIRIIRVCDASKYLYGIFRETFSPIIDRWLSHGLSLTSIEIRKVRSKCRKAENRYIATLICFL